MKTKQSAYIWTILSSFVCKSSSTHCLILFFSTKLSFSSDKFMPRICMLKSVQLRPSLIYFSTSQLSTMFLNFSAVFWSSFLFTFAATCFTHSTTSPVIIRSNFASSMFLNEAKALSIDALSTFDLSGWTVVDASLKFLRLCECDSFEEDDISESKQNRS